MILNINNISNLSQYLLIEEYEVHLAKDEAYLKSGFEKVENIPASV